MLYILGVFALFPGYSYGGPTELPVEPPVAPVVASAAPIQPIPQVTAAAAPLACPEVIVAGFGAAAPAACAISWCESTWQPGATGLEGERGYFQIHPRWHWDATWDPAGNVQAALRISSGGTDWSAWPTRVVLATGVCPGGRIYPGG